MTASALIAVTVALTFSLSAFGQATAKPAVDPKITACLAANFKLDKEIDDLFNKARASNRISDAEAIQYRQLEANIARLRGFLAKDGTTLAECEAITKQYEIEKIKVQKMATTVNSQPVQPNPPGAAPLRPVDPKVAECSAINHKLDGDIDKMYSDAKASGKITPAEAQKFQQMEARIMALRRRFSKDGLSLNECQFLTKEYNAEKVQVQLMIAGLAPTHSPPVDPKMRACLVYNAKIDREIDGIYLQAKAAGKITPAEAAQYQQLERNIAMMRANMQKGGLTLAECQQMSKAYDAEKVSVLLLAK